MASHHKTKNRRILSETLEIATRGAMLWCRHISLSQAVFSSKKIAEDILDFYKSAGISMNNY